ncbi:MAG: gamma-glutamylcyclotransferase [Alphaproteobacteria bacterium]|nr:gamma-glutamylcyclotransferase [Alphaproteobacteria bacterium]
MSAESDNLLFVYGTLRRDAGAPAYALFSEHARYLDDGDISGRMYDLGAYPGVVLSSQSGDHVFGEIYTLGTPEATLALLDRYEGVAGTRGDEPPQYERLKVPVSSQRHGVVAAWIYVYLLVTDDRARIPSGDYLRFLRSRPGR